MILLITLVILVIMSTLGYTLSVQVAARRHRDQYVIDYGIARHACVSGMKYALASVGELEFELISRPNEPDFSDLFALSEVEYQKLLAQMSEYLASQRSADANVARSNGGSDEDGRRSYSSRVANVEIPGPYGPPWPLVTEPIKLEIGSAKVVIAVEDENAKYPLGWTLLTDEKLRDRAGAGWTGLCEWMGYSNKEIEDLTEDLKVIGKTKPFKMEFKTETVDTEAKAQPTTATVTRPGARTSRTTPAANAVARRTVGKKTITAQEQIRTQNSEFSRLFHSSMLNAALLSRPSIESDSRQESAMKYLGLWGTRHVNVNSAPRHVLEAAMTFGSVANAPRIAEAIIRQRKIKPVTDVNEIKQASLAFSDSIEDCRDFLVTSSTVFTIRVTAVSGAARATALAAVTKEGNKVQQIAVVCD
ncbi:MAG TPA: type II secretion system protein GspK [Sedimentisphaerales bacterium]|jgi:hypothetical protein|nr:type II secretion system protein GspK [Sedimentisphaerales bacterium]HNU29843.1 type II secretion system protein GspK [Sedimentisphaerales bacterium]